MEIFWYGHSCFRFTETGFASVVTDPFDSISIGNAPLQLSADIVTISHNKPGHNHVSAINNDAFIIDGAGEYEIGGVYVIGLQTNGQLKIPDPSERNTLYIFDYNGINIVHLGGIDRVPTQNEIEEIGTVHVALVPIGGSNSFNATKAAEVISLLDPNIIVPMHYMTEHSLIRLDPLNKFINEMGLSNVDPISSLKISSARVLPETTQIVVLEPQICK